MKNKIEILLFNLKISNFKKFISKIKKKKKKNRKIIKDNNIYIKTLKVKSLSKV